MTARQVVILNEDGTPSLDVPQVGDTYSMPYDADITGDLSLSGTVDGRDVAADGATLDGAMLLDGTRAITGDIDFGSFDIENLSEIRFNTAYTPVGHTEGALHWNSDEGTLEIDMPGGEVALQVGQELLVRVRNESGVTIPNGGVVWVAGASGNKPLVALADADVGSIAVQTAMATEEILNNSNGYVNLTGSVRGLNTSAYAEGTSLYLSATTPGVLTSTPPSAPNHVYWICVVTAQHATEGKVYFKPTVPMHISDISDFNGIAPDVTNKHIVWNDGNSYWDAGQIAYGDLSGTPGTVKVETGTTYAVIASDNGKVITLDNASAIAVSVAISLPVGFNCVLIQKGAGQVTLTAPPAESILSIGSLLSLNGQGARVELITIASTVLHLAGDLA